MTRSSLFPIALLASTALSVPAALAQTAPAEEADETPHIPGEIVVNAARIKGQVDAAEAPIATLDETGIAALGATSVTDLLDKLSPQTGSGRGRGSGPPLVLVNGQRITNFREMRNYPPEAIRRIEILPEEVALRFGFPPDARVVNMILKDNYRTRRAELEYGVPTHGGFSTGEAQVTMVRIAGPARMSLTGQVERTTPLFEAERGVIQESGATPTVAGDPDPAAWRSLIGRSNEYSLNGSWVKGLGKGGLGGSLTLSGAASRTDSESWSGLDLVRLTAPGGETAVRALDDPLRRQAQTTSLQGGAGLNTFVGNWQLVATLDGSHASSRSRIDRRADTTALVAAAAVGTLPIAGPLPDVAGAGYDTATSKTDSATSLVTLTGRPLRLPAGPAALTLRGGYAWSGIVSTDTRTTTGRVRLTRGNLSGGATLALPIASRREQVLAGLGDLTFNLSGGAEHLSDFGGLTDWSAGLTWSPVEKLSLGASYIVNQAAPSLAQLGSPVVQTFNVAAYDYLRGETALITVTGGGNPQLVKERQRDWKFSANWQLPLPGRSNLLVEYFRNRSSDVSASFPLLTAATEAAFPGRVTRDSAGRLIALDQRAVTLAEQTGSRLRWGLNLDGSIGKAAPGGGGPSGGMRGPGGGGRGGGMMAMLGGPGGGGQGRWNLGLFHTVQFTSRVLIAPGLSELDLLDGDGLTSGGTPRHSLEFNGGMFYRGFGLFSQGTWAAPTTVRASGQPGSSDLRFGAVTKYNVNLFADLGRMPKLVEAHPIFKDTRIALRFENLFDSRQKVTDASGAVPLSYQRDYLDPRGRVIELEITKSF